MAAFKKGISGNPKGRPRGVKNRASLIDDNTQSIAKARLHEAVENGDSWAVLAVVERVQPKLKPSTAPDTLDAEILNIKIREATELLDRIEALEELLKHDNN